MPLTPEQKRALKDAWDIAPNDTARQQLMSFARERGVAPDEFEGTVAPQPGTLSSLRRGLTPPPAESEPESGEYVPAISQADDPTFVLGMVPNVVSDIGQIGRELGGLPAAVGSLAKMFVPGTRESKVAGTAIANRVMGAMQRRISDIPSAIGEGMRGLGKISHERPVSTALNLAGLSPVMSRLIPVTSPLYTESKVARIGGPIRTAYEAGKEGGEPYAAFKAAQKSAFDEQAWMKGLGETVSVFERQQADDYADRLMGLVRGNVAAATDDARVAIRTALGEGVDPHQLWKSVESKAWERHLLSGKKWVDPHQLWASIERKAHDLIDTSVMKRDVDVSKMLGAVTEKAPFMAGETQINYMNRLKSLIQEEAFAAKPTDQKMQILKMAMEPGGVSQKDVIQNLKLGLDRIAETYSQEYQKSYGMLDEAEAALAEGKPIPRHIKSVMNKLEAQTSGGGQGLSFAEHKKIPSWGRVLDAWDKLLKQQRITISSAEGSGDAALLERLGIPAEKAGVAQLTGGKAVPVTRKLEFGDSFIQLSPSQQAELQSIDNYLGTFNTEGRASILDLDAFKKSLGERINEVISGAGPFSEYGLPAEKKARVEKLLSNLYGAVCEETKRGPLGLLYNEMTGKAETAIKMRNETAKLLSLKGENSETIFSKLKAIVPDIDHPEYQASRKVVEDIERLSEYPLMQKLDALNMRQTLRKLYADIETAHDTYMRGGKYEPNPAELKKLDEIASQVLPEDQYVRLKGEYENTMKLWKELQSLSVSGYRGSKNSAIGRLYDLVINPTEDGVTRVFQEKMGKAFPELRGELGTLQGQEEVISAQEKLSQIFSRPGPYTPGEIEGVARKTLPEGMQAEIRAQTEAMRRQEQLSQTFSRPGPYTPGEIEGVARKTLPEGMQAEVRAQTDALRRQEKLADILDKSRRRTAGDKEIGFTPQDVNIVQKLAQEVLPASTFNMLESQYGFTEGLLYRLRSLAETGFEKADSPAIHELGKILLSPTQDPAHKAITSAIEGSLPHARQTVAGRVLNPWFGGGFLPHRMESASLFGGATSKISAVLLFPFLSPRFRGLMASKAGVASRMGGKFPVGRTLTHPAMTGARIVSSRKVSEKEIRQRILGE